MNKTDSLPKFRIAIKSDVSYFTANASSPLPGITEKSRYRCCGCLNGSRSIRARDTDSQHSRIRSHYGIPDTSKATIRTEPMGLSETHHGAVCGSLISDIQSSPVTFVLHNFGKYVAKLISKRLSL